MLRHIGKLRESHGIAERMHRDNNPERMVAEEEMRCEPSKDGGICELEGYHRGNGVHTASGTTVFHDVMQMGCTVDDRVWALRTCL